MIYLIYISIGFVAMQFLNVLLNLVFGQKIQTSGDADKGLISVLIPARNEETNIRILLESLSKIQYRDLEILVYDDQSVDDTARVVLEHGKMDKRIQLIPPLDLPEGWLGKNHACYQLAQNAAGKYLLFIDADLTLMGDIIPDSVSCLKNYRLGLLSVFPKQICKSWGEKISVPVMNYILLTLLPLIFVRISPFKSHAAANGQFMLFDSDIYRKFQPHWHFRSSPVEDILISRFFKSKKIKIACITGDERVQCRMYSSYKEALNGFSKNIFMFFGNIPVLAGLFWIFAALGFIPLLNQHQCLLPLYIALIVLVQCIYAYISRQILLLTLFLFPVHLLFLLHVIIKGFVVRKRRNNLWKGRNIYC